MAGEDFFDFDKGEERKKLTFPKGKVQFQHYSRSGLFVEDLEHEKSDRQELELKIILREWNNSDPSTNGKPFNEDSCELVMKELVPQATKEGKRASRFYLHANTSKAEAAEHGSCLLIEDFVDGEKPAHIYQDDDGGGGGASWDSGSEDMYEAAVDSFLGASTDDAPSSSGGGWKEECAKVKFPKGKLELKHYTLSGLYMWDKEQTGEDRHSPNVELRLNAWKDDKPDEEPLAMFFARDKTSSTDEEAVTIGLLHLKTDTGLAVIDWKDGKDEREMQNIMHHHGDSSYLSFRDKDPDNKDVKIELKHKAGDYLLMESANESDVLYKLNHHNDAGFKVWNTGGETREEIYHPSGAKITIEVDGTVTVKSPVKAYVEAPNIELKGETKIIGDVKIEGNLEVSGDIKFGGTITGPNGAWHNP